jgi:HSP20 family protein
MGKEVPIKSRAPIPAVNDSWHALRHEIDRAFDRFSEGFESLSMQPFTRLQRLWSPGLTGLASLAVDVSETDKAYVITAELPGVEEKDIDVTVEDDLLVIRGEKRQDEEGKPDKAFFSERSYGAFQRMFTLPRGTDTAAILAGFRNGVLTVTIPKSPLSHSSRKVAVKAA